MANRALAAKHDKAKRQTIALVQMETSKACYMTSKPEVPAYDPAMVRRVPCATKPRKTVYRAAKPATLVQTGIKVGSWDAVGSCRLIPRQR